jgi:hypothetical protein
VKSFQPMATQYTSAFLIILGLSAQPFAHAQIVSCSGTLTGNYDEVTVPTSGACTLRGATVRGSVFVSNAAEFTATGSTTIFGNVEASGAEKVTLQNVVISGGFTAENTNIVRTGQAATVTSIQLNHVNSANIGGVINSFGMKDTGSVTFSNATISSAVSSEFSRGNVRLCGSTLLDGISILSGTGHFTAVTTADCPASSINGTISLQKGFGNMIITGASVENADLLVLDQQGFVKLTGITLSDVNVERITGTVDLIQVQTDSDVKFSETGHVSLLSAEIGSDISANHVASFSMKKSSSSSEVLSIFNVDGQVHISETCDVNLNITEGGAVTLHNNSEVAAVAAGATCNGDGLGLESVEITKNAGAISVTNSTGESLTCADNTLTPSGGGNSFGFASGQCAAIGN